MADRWRVERAVQSSELPAGARHIALDLLTRTDPSTAAIPERFSPTVEDLVSSTGRDRSTVLRHLAVLESDGWLVRQRVTRTRPCTYSLRIPVVASCDVAEFDVAQSDVAPADHRASPGGRTTPPLVVAPCDLALLVPDLDQNTAQPSVRKRTARTRSGARNAQLADPAFDEFWHCYPRKKDKIRAQQAWRLAIEAGADPKQIIKAAAVYRDDPGRRNSDPKFTKHPATWLNAGSYLDEADSAGEALPSWML